MRPDTLTALILSGGFSTRMEQLKPLLPLGTGTIIDHVISSYSSNGIKSFVVVGHRGDEIRAAIKNRDISIINNPDYARGMFTSILAGVRQLPQNIEAYYVHSADIPMVAPDTIKILTDSGIIHPGKICYPVFKKNAAILC